MSYHRLNRLTMFIIATVVTACLSTGSPPGCGNPWRGGDCRCDAGDNPSESLDPQRVPTALSGGAVAIRIDHEPGTLLSILDLDPAIRNLIDHNVLESLVRLGDAGNGEVTDIEPELAESWQVDDSGGQFTFNLNPAAQWHDGRPVTAADVAFTFNKVLDPGENAVLYSELTDVANVEIKDSHQVVIHLDQPRPDFLRLLTALSILPAHVFGRTPLIEHPTARAPIGSGPFRFSRWLPGQLIELKRNDQWREKLPSLERVTYRIVPDTRVAYDLLKRGDLDILPNPPAGQSHDERKWRYYSYSLPRLETWVYNVQHPIFARPQSRRAVGQLIDRPAIRCSILHCRAESLYAPPFFSHPAATTNPVSTDAAEVIAGLESDGFKDSNSDGIRERNGVDFAFELLLPDINPGLKRTAALVQNDLARAGIAMRLSLLSWSVFVGRLRTGQFGAAVVTVSTTPPFTPAALFHSRAVDVGYNFGRFEDQQLDEMLERRRLVKASKRSELDRQLSARIHQLHPFTFTFRHFGTALMARHIRGFRPRHGWIEVRHLWIEDRDRRGTK